MGTQITGGVDTHLDVHVAAALDEHGGLLRQPVSVAVAASLVAEQYPEWSHLPLVPVAVDGWDNTTLRLGDHLSVRLPTADVYAPQVAMEHRWLPVLARELPKRIPEPVAMGRPSERFPRPWSISRWIDGDTASADAIRDTAVFAADLAAFLAALYKIDARNGPRAGARNFFRGRPVEVYDTETRESLALLTDETDRTMATRIWERAIATRWQLPAVWVHGDVSPSNLLISDGRLRAVIDFGSAGVGDPACDLVGAWTFFKEDGRESFRRALALDDATWARARVGALEGARDARGRKRER